MSKYPNLFSPVVIRNHTYRNRLIAGPTMFAAGAFIDFYGEGVYRMVERRAQGGFATVATGEINLNCEEGDVLLAIPLEYDKREGPFFEGFKEYASRIKKHGAIAMIELGHDLAYAEVKPPYHPVGPMAFTREDGAEVQAMDEEIMEKIANDYIRATKFMMAAGFDGILLHGGHGFIFQEFISPYFNKRTDEYGGSMENRARFPIRIIDAVRAAGGENMLIEMRMSAEDGLPGGMTIDDMAEFCKIIDGKVDIIHISNGLKWIGNRTHMMTSMYDAHGFNAPYAEKIKKVVTKSKVGVIGGINDPDMAEDIIASGKADFVILGRECFADPEFPNKAANGQEDLIRRCVRCCHCYTGAYREHETEMDMAKFVEIALGKMGQTVGTCAINPVSNFHIDPEKYPVPTGSRNVLVVGGGVAGMQAAITASDRGHKVTLAEKSGVLGGILNFTDFDEFKIDLRDFKNEIIREVHSKNIKVLLNTPVTADFIKESQYDAIIIAVGASPVVPRIEGIETAMGALDLYRNMDKVGKRVVMIGGGLVGCETGLSLAKNGCDVTVIEMLDRIAPEAYAMPRVALLDQMDKYGMHQLLGHKCLSIRPDGVKVTDCSGNETFLEADTVCYCVGMKSNTDISASLKEAAGNIPVYEVGDCSCVGKIATATEAAFKAALEIV